MASRLVSGIRMALGVAAPVAAAVLGWTGFALISESNFRSESSPAGAMIAVIAYTAPIGALFAPLLGIRLIRSARGSRRRFPQAEIDPTRAPRAQLGQQVAGMSAQRESGDTPRTRSQDARPGGPLIRATS